ncbi:MAG: hypothetical protein ACRD6W_10085 [Nitrososphaerales archaeon]
MTEFATVAGTLHPSGVFVGPATSTLAATIATIQPSGVSFAQLHPDLVRFGWEFVQTYGPTVVSAVTGAAAIANHLPEVVTVAVVPVAGAVAAGALKVAMKDRTGGG